MEYGVFFFFGGWMLIMTLNVSILLPETKAVPVEDIMGRWALCVTLAPCFAVPVRVVLAQLQGMHVTDCHAVPTAPVCCLRQACE